MASGADTDEAGDVDRLGEAGEARRALSDRHWI
jgi:hypothetical protein